jgi:peptide/nickel transport system substrate-binding protein
MQAQCMVGVPSIPLGQFIQPTTYRTNLTGVSKGFPTFWSVQRA